MVFCPDVANAAVDGPSVGGVPVDFVLFAITLICVGLFHHHTLAVGLTGMTTIIAYKLAFTGFKAGDGLSGLAAHFGHEWVILANLLGLLLGFALLSKHFEESHMPALLPRFLPDDWRGAVSRPPARARDAGHAPQPAIATAKPIAAAIAAGMP